MTIKMAHVVAALVFGSVSVAHAATQGQPSQPASQGATSVEKNLDANKSGGKADKGLNTAEKHITAKHGKTAKSEGKVEKSEHAVTPERPAMPERPGR